MIIPNVYILNLYIYIPGSTMSHTGTGANELERPILQRVEQGRYPLESATRVTSAGNVSPPASQFSGWETRTGHGSYTKKPQERPARQADQVDACTTQIPERTAQTEHSARKRKECPTEEEQRYNRSRHMECTQTTMADKRRCKRTQLAPPFTHYRGQVGRVDGYNTRVNLAIGP